MGSEHYCLRWNNHQNNLLGVFSQLLHDESLVDVTLACSEGHSIRAHKVVLSACSSYFQSLFIDHPSRHPIVILKDVCFSELRTLIEFMYRGEVNVEYCQLSTLLKTAESLKVKGLAEMTQDLSTRSRTAPPSQENESSSAEPPAHSTALQQRLEASPPVIELTTIKRRLSSEDERNTPSPRPQTPSPPPDCPEPSNLSLKEDRSPSPPDVDDVSSMQSGPSDMTLNSRIPSPLSGEPVPGPSGLPPVQQVPLSLKKEVDWDSRGDDKSTTGESSSDYRHVHDPEVTLTEGAFESAALALRRTPLFDQISNSSATSSRPSTPAFQFPPFPPFAGLANFADSPISIYTFLQQQGLIGGPRHRSEEGFSSTLIRCAICWAGFPTTWLLEQHTALQHSGQPVRGKTEEGSVSGRTTAPPVTSTSESQVSSSNEAVRPSSVPPTPDSSGPTNLSTSNETAVDTLALAIGASEASLFNLLRLSSERQRERRTFACPFCGKCVRSKENLKLHVRKHTGERPFACLFCGRAFGGKSDLTRHLRIHTGERPYHCEMCGKCFARADYLSKHLTTHIHNSQHQRGRDPRERSSESDRERERERERTPAPRTD
ncbi:hypothetical protein M8J76_013175 [Diaphorina citri]|nr:hypothetical protein M8J76_013175 [Diaphorina citri]